MYIRSIIAFLKEADEGIVVIGLQYQPHTTGVFERYHREQAMQNMLAFGRLENIAHGPRCNDIDHQETRSRIRKGYPLL